MERKRSATYAAPGRCLTPYSAVRGLAPFCGGASVVVHNELESHCRSRVACMAAKPVILAVDDDSLALDRVVDELERRYSRDYEILGETLADVALGQIE